MNRAGFSLYLPGIVLFFIIPAACAVLCFAAMSAHAEDLGPLLKGLTRDEVLRMGEAMYRDGILPNGESIQAIVKGDVPVDGTMFTCVSCHLRSGFGTGEGTVRTPPIDGTRLYSSVSQVRGVPLVGRPTGFSGEGIYRPAYTDETLARVIETGIDPAGRQLNTIMPVYFLSERDREIMVYFMKNLSTGPQPGVTETTLRFATVITEDVPQVDREAMLGPLQSYIKNWRLPKSMERTIKSASYRREGKMRDLRTLELSVWELKGLPETWRPQLEEYYRKDPVFALLGGITTGEWAPIHRFCEDRQIPAIFPITDFPVISETDWYTLYLSKGPYQEGEAAARYLHGREDISEEPSVVQVFRDEPAGRALSGAFRDTWVGLGHEAPGAVVLRPDEPITASSLKTLVRKRKHAAVLLWLNARDFPDLELLAKEDPSPLMVFASSSLLGRRMYDLPESRRGDVYLTYPYILPRDARTSHIQAEASPRSDKIPTANPDIGRKMHSLFQTISGPLANMRSFVYRDYFLEVIEATPDLAVTAGAYPRLSFGAGQRYASKGCYIVQLSAGPNPGLIRKSEWVIH